MRIAGNYLLYVLQCWSSCLLHTVTIKMCFIFLKTNRLFQIPKTLTFKTRCKTKYSCKHEFIHMRIKKNIIFMSVAQDSLALKQRFWATGKWPIKFKLQLTRLGRGTQMCSLVAQGQHVLIKRTFSGGQAKRLSKLCQ